MTIIKKSPQTTHAGESVERKELSYTVAGNVNWLVQPLWRTIWRFLKKTKNRATIWPCNDSPGHISGEKYDLKGYMHPPMFAAVLFTIAKTWKQPKRPLTEEWIKKMWYIFTTELLLSHQKECNNAICSNMDGPRNCHTEWSKSE